MAAILALVSCKSAHDGSWLLSQGGETGVHVYPELGPEEKVMLEVIDKDGIPISYNLSAGFTPLDFSSAVRYRARKVGSGTATFVEVIRNGKTHR